MPPKDTDRIEKPEDFDDIDWTSPASGEGAAPSPADGGPGGAGGGDTPAEGREELLRKMRLRRERSRRNRRLAGIAVVLVAVVLLGFAIAYMHLYHKYRDRYEEQPWIQIRTVYYQIDKGLILKIRHKKKIREMERTWLGQEAYFVGVFTGSGETEDPKEILVDIPNLREALNFYEDDVHFELESGTEVAPDLQKGDIVFGKGRVKNFSRYVFRLEGLSLHKVNFIQKHFYKEWTANLPLFQQHLGARALLEDE
jgi:hypothetical protein